MKSKKAAVGRTTVLVAVALIAAFAAIAYLAFVTFEVGCGSGNCAITFPHTQTRTTTNSSSSSSSSPGETILVQVVNDTSMTPISGISVNAGPATSPEDLTFTPGGPTLSECVHVVPNGSSVGSGGAVSNGTTITFPPCPLTEYTTNATGWVSIPNITGTGFYLIDAGNYQQSNYLVVGVVPNNTIRFTFLLPSGNITYSTGGETCTSTCVGQEIPVLWPHTTTVLPCGVGVPNGSAVTPQGVYAGMYISYAFADFPNDTKAAFAYCPGFQAGGTSPVTNTKNDLQLQLSLNTSSSSATGVKVSVSVDEYNTLTSTNNVTAANAWLVHLNGLEGAPCGDDGPTVGFAIAEGHYTSSNITTSKFLDLVDPGASYSCSLYLGYGNPTGFLFQPLSDMAVSYGCNQQRCMSGSTSTSSWGAVTGYWNQGGTFMSFPRGEYTVIAEDEWGELTLGYFNIA